MRRIVVLFAATVALLAAVVAPAAAHQKVVDPPGQAAGHGPTAISKPWAQAHCHARAPEAATASSGGVVTFLPADALPCPATPNPGGNVHPHAGG